jgi:multiple sugar transport system substrate-binding protein
MLLFGSVPAHELTDSPLARSKGEEVRKDVRAQDRMHAAFETVEGAISVKQKILLTILVVLFSSSVYAQGNKARISFLSWPDPGGGFEQVVADFERENPGIHVEIIKGPTSTDLRQDMYVTSFLAGEPTYDMVLMDIIWVPKFAHQGWLLPLDEWFDKEAMKGFLPGDIGGSMYNGRLYRIPLQTDAGMLYYRRDLLEESGLAAPKTWEEFVEVAKRLQKPPIRWGFVFQGKQYEGLVCNFLEFIWSFGGSVFSERGQLALDSPQNVEALAFMCDLIHGQKVTPPGVTTYEEEECRHIFQEGNAVFCRNWPYQWTLAQDERSPVRGKIGIAPLPHKKGHSSHATLGGWGFGISKFTRKKDPCLRFIRYITGPGAQRKLHFRSGIVPARRSLFHDAGILRESPHYADLFKILLRARPRPVHRHYPRISDIISRYVHKALLRQKTPQYALKKAQSQIDKVIRGQ